MEAYTYKMVGHLLSLSDNIYTILQFLKLTWSARMSNNLQVASSDPVANAFPLGKYWNELNKIKLSDQKKTKILHNKNF